MGGGSRPLFACTVRTPAYSPDHQRRIPPFELHSDRFNDAAVDAVARSIQEFGFRQPIVVDKDGVMIVGHAGYIAALKLG
jgi:ParB-like chromosome segregation protein Spo0J